MAGPLKNARHERFCQELARGASQTEAYLRAGYHGRRGRAGKVKDRASTLAHRPEVAARILALKQAAAREAAVDGAAAMRRQEERGRAVITDAMSWDASGKVVLTPSAELTEAQARGIKAVQVHEVETTVESAEGEVVTRTVRRRIKVEQVDGKAADDSVMRATGFLPAGGELGDGEPLTLIVMGPPPRPRAGR